jgi:hypothetical protein
MTAFEVLQQAIQFSAIHAAPGTQAIVTRFGLLSRVIVVYELIKNPHSFLAFPFIFVRRDNAG